MQVPIRKALTILFSVVSLQLSATTYYVAPAGNDRNNGITSPFLTIQHGVNVLRAGDTLYVLTGVYRERIVITGNNGTSLNPIVVTAYPNGYPVIDGAGLNLGGEGNPLVAIYSDYVKLNGFEIRNVDMTGIYKDNYGVYLSGNNVISNCVVHDTYHAGILACGDNNVIEYCTVYNCSMSNSNGIIGSGNSYGVGIRGSTGTSAPAYNNILRHSTIHHVWGETVSAVYTQYTTMEDNVVYQGGIYICNSQHGLYQRNFVFMTDKEAMGEFKYMGIGCADEYAGNVNSDNRILNNIVYGNRSNFFCNNMINCTVANNTFVNAYDESGVLIYPGFTHRNSYFVNNIIIQENSVPCIFYDGAAGITFSNNLWNKAPVAAARGTGDVTSTIHISKTGAFTSTSYYKLLSNSPAVNAGRDIDVDYDFNEHLRNIPDIGAFEYSTEPVNPVNPVYVSSVIENSAPSRLEITYSLSLANIVPAASAFGVLVNSASRAVSSVAVSGTKVILTLASPVASGNVVTVAYTKPAANPLQTAAGGQAASISAQAVTNNVAAAPVPVYSGSVIENSTPSRLEITYSLSLANIVPAASAFTVLVNSASRAVSSVAVSGTKVILTLASPVASGNVVTVAYTKPAANPLQTAAGGQAASISAQAVTNNVAAAPVPVYSGSVIENSTPSRLEITYSLSLANIVPAASAFTVLVNSTARTVSSVAVSGTKVILTLASPVASGNVVTVAYTKPAANPLQTAAGGQAASISAQAVTNNVAAAPVPVYSGSVIENSTPSRLEITYSLSLANIVPAASAFGVLINSASRAVSSVAVSGTKVILTLASPVASGNVVTVAYTKPAANPLQTAAGGQAASISAQAVTNNVAAAPVPVYSGSVIENSTPSRLEITYSLSLANIVPAASAFGVLVNSTCPYSQLCCCFRYKGNSYTCQPCCFG